jgi:hypothetical protein
LDTLVAYFAQRASAGRSTLVISGRTLRASTLLAALFIGLPSACSDFEGYGRADAGAGGSSGTAGSAGSDGSAEPDASVGGSGPISDAGVDATVDAAAEDAAAPDADAPGDGGSPLPERYASCEAICDTQEELQDCGPADDCVETLCGEVAIAELPADCVDEYDAYNECLATEPVGSFICSGDRPIPAIGANGCSEEECAFFTCLGVPTLCGD